MDGWTDHATERHTDRMSDIQTDRGAVQWADRQTQTFIYKN